MKRIFLTLTLILTAIFLVSCKGNKDIIDIKVLNEDHTSNSLNFRLVINDLDSLLEGKVKLELLNKDGDKKGKITPEVIELGQVETDVAITGLEINTQYTLNVLGTIRGKSKKLLSRLINTKNNKQYDVKTAEDFLNIKKDSYGTYTLLNDIDFTGVELKQGDLMPTFYGVLDGQGYTVKNMTVDYSSSPLYKGIFEQNNRDSVIKNIKFDNIQFGTEENPLSKNGTQYIGLIVGSTSTTSTIDNVTVTNSKIYYESKTTSTNHSVGILVGRNQGTIKNVVLEDNEIHYDAKKVKSLKVGGAIGLSRTKTSSVKDLFVNNNVNLVMDLEDHGSDNIDIHVGGAIGFVQDPSRTVPANSIISKSNIVITDLGIKAKEIAEDAKDQTIKMNVYVGGIIGDFTVSAIQQVLYDGSITINHEPQEQEPAEDKKLVNIEVKYTVGGIVGDYSTSHKLYDVILKKVEIEVNTDSEDLFVVGDVFGYKSNPTIQDDVKYYEDFESNEAFEEELRDLFSSKIVDKYLE